MFIIVNELQVINKKCNLLTKKNPIYRRNKMQVIDQKIQLSRKKMQVIEQKMQVI